MSTRSKFPFWWNLDWGRIGATWSSHDFCAKHGHLVVATAPTSFIIPSLFPRRSNRQGQPAGRIIGSGGGSRMAAPSLAPALDSASRRLVPRYPISIPLDVVVLRSG